jgi:hypothetical protein
MIIPIIQDGQPIPDAPTSFQSQTPHGAWVIEMAVLGQKPVHLLLCTDDAEARSHLGAIKDPDFPLDCCWGMLFVRLPRQPDGSILTARRRPILPGASLKGEIVELPFLGIVSADDWV